MQKIRIIENFITWQGESLHTGQRMLLLRFKTCNRTCKFCDTQVKLRVSQEFDFPLKEIQKIVNEEKCGLLISGGEPTFSDNLDQTVSVINKIKTHIYDVETNGVGLEELIKRVNKNKNVYYILSPKLFNQTDLIGYKRLTELIRNNKRVQIKIVTEDRPEIHQYLDFLRDTNFDMTRVWCMVEGTTKEELLSHAGFVFDMAEKYKCNFSSREHIIYGFV